MRSNARIVLCSCCGSEGHIYWLTGSSDNYGNSIEASEPCPWCEATGGEVIETQPIEMDDLDIIAGAL